MGSVSPSTPPVRVAPVTHGLGVLATRRIEKGELIWEETPIVVIRQNPSSQMADPELRPLLEKCVALCVRTLTN